MDDQDMMVDELLNASFDLTLKKDQLPSKALMTIST